MRRQKAVLLGAFLVLAAIAVPAPAGANDCFVHFGVLMVQVNYQCSEWDYYHCWLVFNFVMIRVYYC